MPNVHEINRYLDNLKELTPEQLVENVDAITELTRSLGELPVADQEFYRAIEMCRLLILWNMEQFDPEIDVETDNVIRTNESGTVHCVEEKGSIFMMLKAEDDKAREHVAARLTYETLDQFIDHPGRTRQGLMNAMKRVAAWEQSPPIFVFSSVHTWDTGDDIGGYSCQILPKDPRKQYTSPEDERKIPTFSYDGLEYEMHIARIDTHEGATFAEGIAPYPYTSEELIWDTAKLFEMHLTRSTDDFLPPSEIEV